MNWSKAKATLSSINRLIAIFEEADDLSAIERDLLLKRIQELYGFVLLSETHEDKRKQVRQTPVPQPVVETPKVEVKIETPKPPVTPTPPPVVPPIVIEKPKPKPIPIIEPVIVEKPKPIEVPIIEKPIYREPVKVKKVEPIYTPPSKPNQEVDEEIEDLFEFKSATDLSEKLSDAPIKDLKASMSINERFLTISELFKGNAARYNEVVEVLNGLSNFDQAKSYLMKVVIPEFDWTAEKKQGLAKRFIKKVNRRFL
jgi:hypothetical protein